MISPRFPRRSIGELANGHPHLDATGILVILWHDSDNRVGLSVECNGLIQDAGLSTEASLPETVAKYDHRCTTRLIFFVREHAPQCRVNAQNGKEVCRNLSSDNAFGFPVAGQVIAVAIVDTDLFNRLVLCSPVFKVGIRD